MSIQGGAETTFEEDVIYNPEIEALILEAEDRLATGQNRKMILEGLVVRAIRVWGLE